MWDKHSKQRIDFLAVLIMTAAISRNLKYFGNKLVTVCTLRGIPIVYDLVPANTYERLATETVIDYFSFCDFFGDKGFLGWKWQTQVFDQTYNLIWTPHRANQHHQNAPGLDRWLIAFVSASKVSSMKCRIQDGITSACWRKPSSAAVPVESFVSDQPSLTPFAVI